MLKVITAALLAAAALAPNAASAATGTSVAVSYADLNLGSSIGRTLLQHRITAAAADVCEYGKFQDIGRMSAATSCRAGAIDAAQPAYEQAVASARRGTVTVLSGASLIVTAQ